MRRIKFLSIFVIILSMVLTSCQGSGGQSDTISTAAESTPPAETAGTAPNAEPRSSVTVENPDWGYDAHSVSVSDGSIVSAELDKETGNVTLTSYNPGEAEVYVHDCFDHKALIKVNVADDADCTVTYEASPCTEEYIDAADFGVRPGKSSSGLPDYSAHLQKAINYAYNQGGGTVYLYPGFYYIKVLRMREGVTLKMYSGFTDASEGFTDELAEMIKKGEVTVLINSRIMNADYNDYGRNGSSNFTISGGVIDNNHTTTSTVLFGLSENIVVENAVFKDIKNNHVFQITGCNNVTIRNCIFAGFEWGGTFTRETIQIEQSHPGAHGSNPDTTPQRFENGEIYGSKNITIDSCYFGPSDELPGAHIAIGHHGTAHEAVCDNLTITNNIFDSPTYAAIRFANIVDAEITGNKFIASKDSNKLCDNADPAFIIIYSNTSNVTYENIINGQKVYKAIPQEQSGSHNLNISNNEFTVSAGSDKRIITAAGTSFTPGAIFKAGVLRQDTYDSKPYVLTGYFKSTNYIGNLNFSDNKVTYEGQPEIKDAVFKFTNVYGLRFEDNDISLTDCNFRSTASGIEGLYISACYTGEKAETYTIESKSAKNYLSIPYPNGSEARLIFRIEATHSIIAAEGGRIELSSDTKGNIYVTVIPNEGYIFAGWTSGSGAFTDTGDVNITSKITLTAEFTKKQ